MAENDDSKGRGNAGPNRRRPAKPQVTIDLSAEPVDPKRDEAGPAGEAPETPVPTAETAVPPAADPAESAEPGDAPEPAEAAKPANEHAPPPSPSARRQGTSATMLVASAVIGGIVATILGIVVHAMGLAPSPTREAANAAVASAAALAGRVDALEARRLPDLQPLADRLAAIEGRAGALATDLAALGERLGAAQATTGERFEGIAARLSLLEGAPSSGNGIPAGDLGAISRRIGALEAEVSRLSNSVAALDSGQAGARMAAMTSLTGAAERGEPLGPAIGILASLGVAEDRLAPLRPFADRTVPSRAAIAAAFPPAAEAILASERPPSAEGGILDRIWDEASRLVTIRPTGPQEGDSVPAIVSRMRAAVERGDLQAALAERDSLPEAGKAASAAWAETAATRIELDRHVGELASALAASTGGGAAR